MIEKTLQQFQNDIEKYVDQAIENDSPLKVICGKDRAFIVIDAEEWKRKQETIYILQNRYDATNS